MERTRTVNAEHDDSLLGLNLSSRRFSPIFRSPDSALQHVDRTIRNSYVTNIDDKQAAYASVSVDRTKVQRKPAPPHRWIYVSVGNPGQGRNYKAGLNDNPLTETTS
jgi:hypothetical protein